MKFFRNKAVMADNIDSQKIVQKIEELEDTLREMRTLLGERRTMLTNADKKLQQFQDSIYAVLIEEERPSRKARYAKSDDSEPIPPVL
jgi:hypothetical protein